MTQPTPEAEPTPETEPTASTKKKKRKRGAPDGAGPDSAAPVVLPGEGTPEGVLLREANAAFEAGNYASVRELTTKLRTASDPKIVDAAGDLARRVAVDPVQIGFLTACLLAIIIISDIYVIR